MNPEKLCLGCMEELEHSGEPCKRCGFDRTSYEKKRNMRVLPSYTILAGKYLLGRVLGEGGFGITYLAWDLNRECFLPNGLAIGISENGVIYYTTDSSGVNDIYYEFFMTEEDSQQFLDILGVNKFGVVNQAIFSSL